MQAIMETLFDVCYLVGVITVGILMIRGAKGNKQTLLFGWMSVILGVGDSFHLVPRAYALWTIGLEANAVALGIGKFITSITMTVFYLVLYHIWKERYQVKQTKVLSIIIYALAGLRILTCFCPRNEWLNYHTPLSFGIYRNIPFAIMGIIIIILFYQQAKQHKDKTFGFMWFAIVLSFAFYIPVVLWAATFPMVGMLMIPKTLAYVWIVAMGYTDYKNKQKIPTEQSE